MISRSTFNGTSTPACQKLPQKAFRFGGKCNGIPKNPKAFRGVVKSDGILGAHEQRPVKGFFVEILCLFIQFIVDGFTGVPGLVRGLKKLGDRGRGISGAQHHGHGAVLNGENPFLEPVGALGMALVTGPHLILDRTHHPMVGNLIHTDLGVGMWQSAQEAPALSARCCSSRTQIPD